MTISTYYYYKIFTVLALTTSLLSACTKELPSLDFYDPLFQVKTPNKDAARLLAQPITMGLAEEFPHLTPFVGHLILGNQLVQTVIAGVPPLPYPSPEHPLILQIFQKAKGSWQQLERIPELKLAVRSNAAHAIQPVALQHELGPGSASIRLRYGNPNNWQQEPLTLHLTLPANENRLQLRWQRQTQGERTSQNESGERRYQLRVGIASSLAQINSFEDGQGQIYIVQNQLDALALIEPGEWQPHSHANHSWLIASERADQDLPLRLDLAIGRFGLMELGARYLPKPHCAFANDPLPSSCIQTDDSWQLTETKLLVAPRPSQRGYFATWPLIKIELPGLDEPLLIPAEPRESISMHLPAGTKLGLDGASDQFTVQASSNEPEAATVIRLNEVFQTQAFPIAAMSAASRSEGLFHLSLRSTRTNRPLVFHPLDRANQDTPSPELIATAIPLKAPAQDFDLEQGRYHLSIYHDLGVICQEEIEVSPKAAISLHGCKNPASWTNKLNELTNRSKAWVVSQANATPPFQTEAKALELSRHQSSASDASHYEFYDPNFALSLRIRDSKSDSDLTESWRNYRLAQRSASIFSLRHFLASHAPTAQLELSCPHQTISVHDFESTAKALNAHIFAIFSCHGPAYEDQLFHAVDRLQASRDQALRIVASQNQGLGFQGQRARPKFLNRRDGSIQTLGAGAVVQIQGLQPESSEPEGKNQPSNRYQLKFAADVFSEAHKSNQIRVIAIQQNGQLLTVAEQAWQRSESSDAGMDSTEISLELPPTTRYLRAELLTQVSDDSKPQNLRLATSQYWPVKAAKHAQRIR